MVVIDNEVHNWFLSLLSEPRPFECCANRPPTSDRISGPCGDQEDEREAPKKEAGQSQWNHLYRIFCSNFRKCVKDCFYWFWTFQAHSSSGEFPSITLSACDDDDNEDDDDDDLFTIQRDTVLDVGEVRIVQWLISLQRDILSIWYKDQFTSRISNST